MVNQADNGSPAPIDDIPEALRETVIGTNPNQPHASRFWGMVGLGAIALLGSGGFAVWRLSPFTPLDTEKSKSQTATLLEGDNLNLQSTLAEDAARLELDSDTLLGHRAYETAPLGTLESVTADGGIKLRKAAAAKLIEMLAQAQTEGVDLRPISGFRSIEDQRHLFFDIKAVRGESTTTRAEVSAPPGYSEHHTGYAVDFVDGSRSETDLEQTFEETPAFQWLQKNAAHYGFELSFSKNNPQEVAYEPWHWRFVGDQHSLETFYKNHP
ncbi:MAG: D-alanyl-D-alanine carboxypeptidase family protein [Pseudanabaenales cyanobacterium]|nr:D-alanyl-D-alanine carboxypeptidase family protein [Pseudanabaenales cyanobacterium]